VFKLGGESGFGLAPLLVFFMKTLSPKAAWNSPPKTPGLWLKVTMRSGDVFQAFSPGSGCLPLLYDDSFVLERPGQDEAGRPVDRRVRQTFQRQDLLALEILSVIGARGTLSSRG
jgi:hypothetical protein